MTTDKFKPLPLDPPIATRLDESVGIELQNEIDSDTSMLYEAWVVLRRRRYWVLIFLALSIIASFIFAKMQAPEFDSASVIRILESNNGGIQFGDSPASQLLGGNDENKIQTEMSILKSKTLALRVADKLDLYGNMTFSKAGKKEGPSNRANPVTVYRILKAMVTSVRVSSVPHTDDI